MGICVVESPWKRALMSVGLGQILSLLLAGTGVASQKLVTLGVSVPTTQSAVLYVTLALIFVPVLVFQRGIRGIWEVLRERGKFLVPLAIVDVEANFLVVLAFRFTDITSIMLLDCFTIPAVMALSFVFLRVRYTLRQCIGVVVCIAGLATLVISDALKSGPKAGSNPLLGDIICIAGASLYAVSNVGQEYLVKSNSVVEWLGFVGLFGSIVSCIQATIFEGAELSQAGSWTIPVFLFLGLFAGCIFVLYSVTPHLMRMSSATLFNLSILTSDVLAVFASIVIFHRAPSGWYFLAFAVICVGLAIYSSEGIRAEHKRGYAPVVDPPDIVSDGSEDGPAANESQGRDG